MVVGEASKPKRSADLSVVQEVAAMERIPKNQWSSESAGDKLPCAVPMMLYRDVLKSNSECSSLNTGQKYSSSTSQIHLSSEFDLEINDPDHSSSSSTATLTNSWENTSLVPNNHSMNMVADLECDRSKGNSGDQPSKKMREVVKGSVSLPHTPADQREAQHKEKHQKDFIPFPDSRSPIETSSGISMASEESDSTTSSVESGMFYPDPEKLSKQSGSDSAMSSCVLSVANFDVSSGTITPGLISTAYSRLKDRDMLYRKRIKELEKEVKKVPILEMKLATLREENRLLLLQLKFCSGKTRSNGVGETLPSNVQTCDSSNSNSKHVNCNNKSPEPYANSTGSSDMSEMCNTGSPKCNKNYETRSHGSLKKLISDQTETAKAVSPEITNSHESTTSVEVRQNCEWKEERNNQSNKDNLKCDEPKPLDLSISSNSLKSDREVKPSRKSRLKCPRCSFCISNESEMNLKKDQDVQTDPHIFTIEKSTQTPADEALKSLPFEYFMRHLEATFSEGGVNSSECPATDQILNILKYIACYISNDSQQRCNSPAMSSVCCQFHAKLTDLFSIESPNANTSEASTASVETDSTYFHSVKERSPSLTRRNKRYEVLDSCLGKVQKESGDMRDKKMKICSLKIQNSDKIEIKQNESPTPFVDNGLTYSVCRSPQKARTDFRSALLNSLPISPFLPSQEEHKTGFLGENERQAPCLSPISDFEGYSPEVVSSERKNEVILNMKNETGPKKTCDNTGASYNTEVQVITDLDGNDSRSNEHECNKSHITLEGDKLSEYSGYSTEERKKRCRSPSLMSDSPRDSEVPHINQNQESQSQVFEVEDIKEELFFPDEVKDAYKRISDYLLKQRNLDGQNLQEPVNLVKKHWFGVTCSPHASPILLQKYLNEVSQYPSVLPQWVVNLHDGFGNTALHFTVANKRLPMLDALLRTGICDVNKRNKAGFTSVMLASANKLQNDLDRQLMKKLVHMSDVNAKSYLTGETALTLASGHGVEDMVELLIEAGADVNAQDNDGSTALMYAAAQGFLHIAKKLASHPNCDFSLKDNDGVDACCVALRAGFPNIGLLIYFHASSNLQASKGKSRKCKKWLKTSARNLPDSFLLGLPKDLS